MRVAALYIDPRGHYPTLPDVDAWDERRDARLYNGPGPVVAHPPCGPWGRLRHLYRGAEHDCAPRAVEQVRAFGGVLEHPANSRLWKSCSLPEPGCFPDEWGGYTIEVDQCDFGHVARKKTWLPRGRAEFASGMAPASRADSPHLLDVTIRAPEYERSPLLLEATAPPHAARVRSLPRGARGGGATSSSRGMSSSLSERGELNIIICEHIGDTRPGLPGLAQAVAREHGCDVFELFCCGDDRRISAAKHALWLEMKHNLGMSTTEIAEACRFDRNTVWSGLARKKDRDARAHRRNDRP